MVGFLRKLLNWIENISIYLAIASSFSMMCLTMADALGRYILNQTIPGAYEFTENYLMVATVFFGVCYAYHGGVFIRVTFFVNRLPIKVKVFVNYFVQLFSFLLGLIFAIATTKHAFQTLTEGTTLDVLLLPVSPACFIVPVGFFLLSLLMLLDLRRVRTGKSDLLK
jgi:TRAP-type C4-dicarboxylate transport system permease small subunit